MSGHSKWANIKRRKEAVDNKRAQVYSKIGVELTACVKSGGPDPNVNTKLKDIIAKAKANNMPSDNITRCIQKASGSDDGKVYEEITYEGFGPYGVAIIVEALTDNKNRAAADIRCIFDRSGGSMGQSGTVGYMFKKMGVIVIEKTESVDVDELMLLAIDNGANDFTPDEEYIEITCDVASFSTLRETLDKAGYILVESEIKQQPTIKKQLTEEETEKFEAFIDKLESNDDVQNVWNNAECE